jgi:hypothetical protein
MARDKAGPHQIGTATCFAVVASTIKRLKNHCLYFLADVNELRRRQDYINKLHNGATGLGMIRATGPWVNGGESPNCG